MSAEGATSFRVMFPSCRRSPRQQSELLVKSFPSMCFPQHDKHRKTLEEHLAQVEADRDRRLAEARRELRASQDEAAEWEDRYHHIEADLENERTSAEARVAVLQHQIDQMRVCCRCLWLHLVPVRRGNCSKKVHGHYWGYLLRPRRTSSQTQPVWAAYTGPFSAAWRCCVTDERCGPHAPLHH